MKIDILVKHNSVLKDYLLEYGLSKKLCRKIKLYGKMYINGVESKNYFPVKTNDLITLVYDEQENDDIKATEYKLDIVYEDEHILVINKPYDLASQPSKLHYENNVISYVKKYFKDNNINSNIHVVNRLDYQTSGLMTIAKDGYTHYLLTKEKVIKRKYYCLVEGILDQKEGLINLPIARKEENGILREVNSQGKEALTKYKVIAEYNNLIQLDTITIENYSLVDVELLTGRTHQIRVHFSYLNYPLIGDKLYGHAYKRLMLHCYYLSFINPYTGKFIEIINKPQFIL